MHARTLDRVALALALSTLTAGTAWAGGGHGGAGVHRVGGIRGGFGGFHGGYGAFNGGPRFGGGRGLPPIAGVIHEGQAGRPYVSAYGHTNTAARFGGFPRGGVPAYGRGPWPASAAGYGSQASFARTYAQNAYGHVDTGLRYAGLRYAVGRRFEGVGYGRRRFAAGRGFVGGYGGLGFAGGFGAGYGGYGGYGDASVYGQPGVYGGQGIYGGQGTYGGQGSYGSTATQAGYGSGGVGYRSETPLAVRFAEPPLGPSPYAPYSPGDRYAYAASADVGPGPRVLNPYRAGGCACGPRREPTIYRYGVGTAY